MLHRSLTFLNADMTRLESSADHEDPEKFADVAHAPPSPVPWPVPEASKQRGRYQGVSGVEGGLEDPKDVGDYESMGAPRGKGEDFWQSRRGRSQRVELETYPRS